MIKAIDHVVITTGDIDACIGFYTRLGFTHKHDGVAHELFAGAFKINVHVKAKELYPHARHATTGSADLCFELSDNIATFQTELCEKGLAVELGIVSRMGARGYMHSLYLRDPDGCLLEFCSYE